ncbi:MAG: DUF1573 domain-containing protein [Sphingobacteriaceae bacterium]|jgi:Protein of unknown function (DUF1573)|nr:DUF1573 domain-containing protein [Sphingobacteriaceae bacterium]
MNFRTLYIFIIISVLTSCGSEEHNGIDSSDVSNNASANGMIKGNVPEIKFEEDVFDFGKITQGEVVSHDFKFKNIGNQHLIISGASGSCGCTVPKWPKEPILPGKEGKLNVVFSSEGKKGIMEKTVTIVTNCEPSTRIIRIKAEVIVMESIKEPGY